MPDWTATFFNTIALDTWQRSQSPETTQAEVDYLVDALQLGPEPQRVLDVPCGDGRHAVALASLGHVVTCVDSASENERRVALRAAEAGVAVDFIAADMRAIPSRPAFDGAYCFGNSFGYFPRGETQSFLTSIARALRVGARFVIDTACSAESILLDLNRASWIRIDSELVVLMRCEYDARESRLDTTYTSLVAGSTADERTAHNYVLTTGEIVSMLDAAGFTTLDLFADLEGTAFELGSERLLIVAQRR